jgi:hypothetical protein
MIKSIETVVIPKKDLEKIMFKVFNILNALEDIGEITVGIQKELGYEVTSEQLMNFFKYYGVDIE